MVSSTIISTWTFLVESIETTPPKQIEIRPLKILDSLANG